jgi:hypothetical protein
MEKKKKPESCFIEHLDSFFLIYFEQEVYS